MSLAMHSGSLVNVNELYAQFEALGEGKEAERLECYRRVIRALFYGSVWVNSDYSMLGALTRYDRKYLGRILWQEWSKLDHSKVVVNEQTGLLARQMILSIANSSEPFQPGWLGAGAFSEIFPGAWEEALKYINQGKLPADTDLFLWLQERGEIKDTINPFDKNALVAISKHLGDKLPSFKLVLNGFRRSMMDDEFLKIMIEWLDALGSGVAERMEGKTDLPKGDIFPYAVLASSAGSDRYRAEIIRKAAASRTWHWQIKLGRPFIVPAKATGKMLCQMLAWLSEYVVNKSCLRNLPSEDEFKTRTVELLLDGESSLYERGLKALRALSASTDTRETREEQWHFRRNSSLPVFMKKG